MISIGGNTFTDSLGYPSNGIEGQVLTAMQSGTELYSYDNLEQLQFELTLRREIVNAAMALYKSGLGFAVFHRSKCNEEYWYRTPNGGFRLKPGANTAEAINDIFTNGRAYATECATAMMIVYYKALLSVYGEEKFNRLFPTAYLMNWHTSDPLLRAVGTPKPVGQLLLGDRAYFANPDVDPQVPQWQGENVIVLPKGLYYGHGVGIKNAQQIIRSLNSNRESGSNRSAYLMESAGRPDFKKLAAQVPVAAQARIA